MIKQEPSLLQSGMNLIFLKENLLRGELAFQSVAQGMFQKRAYYISGYQEKIMFERSCR